MAPEALDERASPGAPAAPGSGADADAQSAEAEVPVPRPGADPTLAACLCALPGLGQLYNRQPGKALFFLVATVGCIGGAVVLIMNGERLGLWLLRDSHSGVFLLFAFASILVFLAVFCAGLSFWASSVADARRVALARRHGTAVAAADSGRWWLFRL